jgi:hypothetical protein
MLTPARPSIARLAVSGRLCEGAPYRQLLLSASNQTLRIGQIKIRI